ncbi:MAG: S8 family peptidase [Crocinitomicaceae bacterium]
MKHFFLGIAFILAGFSFAQRPQDGKSISLSLYEKEHPNQLVDFGVKGSINDLQGDDRIYYKYAAAGWHFIRCTSADLSELIAEGKIRQVYFTPNRGQALCDTMRIVQNIDSVHNGHSPLLDSLTGKGVIIGYIDTGLDYTHDDFKNPDGSTRVLYYWDHTLPYDAQLTPGKYGYGQVWDSTAINDGSITSMDNNAHGTTVTGAGSGNGLASGTHKGAAPESDIIIVESNFSLPNWTLTVADGIDFIFSMADTLGKPVVVNTSVGSYLGSHDGTDPAAMIVDSLLNEKAGRIVVAAAGNSGNQGKYHLKATVTSDTSFTWFEVNPSSAFGSPAVFFDLWADTADLNNVNFAFGADNPSPTYDFRGRTSFYSIPSLLNTTTYDSIMVNGNKLAPVSFYCEEINGVYHIEALLENIDSVDYLYRFETVGDGAYDLWSGAWLGLSDIKDDNLPTVIDFPPIDYYHLPDTFSTLVSSWSAAPSTVTVGNFVNQKQYLDYNSNLYVGAYPPGELSRNSSKGPNRMGVIKPDISASGDLILATCPLWLASSLQSSNPSMLAESGLHVRNGGTSMAAPVIAGIAALYLEKCPTSTYQDFLTGLQNEAHEDSWTQTTPNIAYGYGKIDAFQLLSATQFDVTLQGDTLICDTPVMFDTEENNFSTYAWHNGDSTSSITLDISDTVFVTVTNSKGCAARSDSIIVIKGSPPPVPVINQIGGGLVTSTADSIQWYYEGVAIDSANSQYINPDTTGNYSVALFGPEGCSHQSAPYWVDLSQLIELQKNEFIIFPNPFHDKFSIIKSDFNDVSLYITDVNGKLVYDYAEFNSSTLFIDIDMRQFSSGVYFMIIYFDDNFNSYQLVKE